MVGLGLTAGPHPVGLYREVLASRGAQRAADLRALPHGSRVRVSGAVICRQTAGHRQGVSRSSPSRTRPGLVNVTVRPDLFAHSRDVLLGPDLLEIDGMLQTREGCLVRALAVRPLRLGSLPIESRDFR